MATVITELDTVAGKQEDDVLLNISATDVSIATDIKAATVDYLYGVKSIIITGAFAGTEWFKILDGEDVLIGPVEPVTGIPWSKVFRKPIYCTRGNALKIQTQSALNLHCLLEVVVGIPVPSPSISASPSM